jgi:hypothetical protein
MIRTYYLETETINDSLQCKAQQYIHNAMLSIEGNLRKLVQDTTSIEHDELIKAAKSWRLPTDDETVSFTTFKNSHPIMAIPRDLAKEIDDLKTQITTINTKLAIK